MNHPTHYRPQGRHPLCGVRLKLFEANRDAEALALRMTTDVGRCTCIDCLDRVQRLVNRQLMSAAAEPAEV